MYTTKHHFQKHQTRQKPDNTPKKVTSHQTLHLDSHPTTSIIVYTPITYEQYLNLINQYKAMSEEIRWYNNMRSSQPWPTAPRQPSQRLNVNLIQSDSLEIEDESTHSWQPTCSYENIDKSDEASEPLSTQFRRKKVEASEIDQEMKRDLKNIMWELQ